MRIDIATTATARPELYERTLRSFKPLFDQWPEWRLILNVDPAGPGSVQDVIDIGRRWFPDHCIRSPSEPDFRQAWRWCVSQLQSQFVLWLEDDWELTQPIDFGRMVELMTKYPDLATLRLPRWESSTTFRQWNKRALQGWMGEFFLIPPENIRNCGYSNNPSLTRSQFLTPVLPHLKKDMDPEKQMAGFNSKCLWWLHRWAFGVYQRPFSPASVRDIGEQWRKARGIGKGDKMNFKTWETKDGKA